MALNIGMIVRPRGDEDQMKLLREAVERLRAQGHEVRPRVTFEAGDAGRFASAAANSGAELVIAAGGDGTINEVINGIVGAETRPRLGIIPIGTANDFAAGLNLPFNIADAMQVVVGSNPMDVDLGRVNDRYFINVSTGGFGAEATEQTSSDTKRLLGSWAYVITGVRKFVELRPVRGTFRSREETLFEGEFLMFAVGNGRQTGGGTLVTPRAELDDGNLDVLIVPALPRMDFLSLLPDLRAGTHLETPELVYVQTPDLVVESEEPLSVNVDGEPLRGSRFEYRLSGSPMTVMAP